MPDSIKVDISKTETIEKPRFKVGDKVTTIAQGRGRRAIGEITKIDGEQGWNPYTGYLCMVKFKKGKDVRPFEFYEAELELVTSKSTIPKKETTTIKKWIDMDMLFSSEMGEYEFGIYRCPYCNMEVIIEKYDSGTFCPCCGKRVAGKMSGSRCIEKEI